MSLYPLKTERMPVLGLWASHECDLMPEKLKGTDSVFYSRKDDGWFLGHADFEVSSLGDYPPINYCPWCGAYLGDFNADDYDALEHGQ